VKKERAKENYRLFLIILEGRKFEQERFKCATEEKKKKRIGTMGNTGETCIDVPGKKRKGSSHSLKTLGQKQTET